MTMDGQGTPSSRAGGTIRPFRFVKASLTEDNTVLECNAGERPLGISSGDVADYTSDNHAVDGDDVRLQTGNVLRVEVGAAVVRGYPIGPDADGKAVEGGGGYATALQSATATGAIIEVLFKDVPGIRPSISAAAALTLTPEQSGAIIDNLGATGAVVVSLPQAPPEGTEYIFVVKVAQELRIEPGAGGGFYIGGAKQTDNKYITADDEAESVHLVADSAGDWTAIGTTGTWGVET